MGHLIKKEFFYSADCRHPILCISVSVMQIFCQTIAAFESIKTIMNGIFDQIIIFLFAQLKINRLFLLNFSSFNYETSLEYCRNPNSSIIKI